MSKILIVTESASDIPLVEQRLYDIKVLPFKITMGEKTYLTGIDFTNEEFYQMLQEYNGVPTTSQITTYEFQNFYEDKMNEGYTDIIMVLINGEGSATFTNAIYAKRLFLQEYQNANIRIHIYDSRSYSGGYGSMVIEAAKMNQNGESASDICAYLEDKISKSMIYFGMYSLKYAAKSGRIPSAAAFVGEALGLKPLMKIWDHKITTHKKIRGEKLLIPSLVEETLKNMEPNTPYVVLYGNDFDVAQKTIELMVAKVGYPPVRLMQIGAAITINSGPRAFGIAFEAQRSA